MAKQGDNNTPRSVKGEFDNSDFSTPHGGAILVEKAMRRLGLRKALFDTLPERGGDYKSEEVATQVVAGLLCGGKGFQSTTPLAIDKSLARIFSVGEVVSDSTVYRAMCDFAGLEQRNHGDVYTEAGPSLPAMDVFGETKEPSRSKRIVPETPEAASDVSINAFNSLVGRSAHATLSRLKRDSLTLHGYTVVFGDGTDLEVKGACFDAAQKNRNGERSLRAMTAMVGPVITGVSILPGNTDEGKSLPDVFDKSVPTIRRVSGKRPVLALLDGAFAEADVVNNMRQNKWKYIICANQYRQKLERMADEQPEEQWSDTGADAARGWTESAVLLMTHLPEGWGKPVTVVARRYRKEGEIVDRYSFLYTNLSSDDFAKSKTSKIGLASFIWQLYGTKQGRENNFKCFLSDLGMHNPPSGRLGATQAFATLAAVAANVHAFLAHRVVPKTDHGIRLWRFIRDYTQISGRLVMQSGRKLLVRLAGGGLPDARKRNWLLAQEALEAT